MIEAAVHLPADGLGGCHQVFVREPRDWDALEATTASTDANMLAAEHHDVGDMGVVQQRSNRAE
jgi:hypothetical protein